MIKKIPALVLGIIALAFITLQAFSSPYSALAAYNFSTTQPGFITGQTPAYSITKYIDWGWGNPPSAGSSRGYGTWYVTITECRNGSCSTNTAPVDFNDPNAMNAETCDIAAANAGLPDTATITCSKNDRQLSEQPQGCTNQYGAYCNSYNIYGTESRVDIYSGALSPSSSACLYPDGYTNPQSVQSEYSASTCSTSQNANAAAAPTASLSANPSNVVAGGSSALTYSCTNATSASISGVGSVSPSSGTISVSPGSTTTYTLTCTGAGGSTSANTTVTVTPALAASCSVSPTSISTGGSATWSSSASGGSGTYAYSWSGTDGLSGTNSSVSKTYSDVGTKTGSVTVTSGTQSVTVNCGNTLNVSMPAITGSCSVSPSSVTVGQAATWTSNAGGGNGSYIYSWSGTDGLSGTGSSVSPTYSAAGTKTASVTITSGGVSNTFACSNSLSVAAAPQPDLTAGTVSPTSATAGTAVTFSASASNIGNATSGSFPILFQIQNSSSQDVALLNSSYLAGLAPSASAPGSVSYTFASAGTYRVRACANYNTSWAAITSESDYGNNCGGWTTVTVASAQQPAPPPAPAPTCSFSASPPNNTPSTLSWSSTNATSCTGGGFSTGGATSGSASVSTAGNYTLSCAGSGGSCPTQTVNVGTTCSNPTPTISASPPRVKKGSPTSITWGATGVNGSCSLTRNGAIIATVSANSCNVTPPGSTSDVVNQQNQYCVVCGTAAPVCTIVNILPQFQEF